MVVIKKLARKQLYNYYYNLEVVEFMNQNLQNLTDYSMLRFEKKSQKNKLLDKILRSTNSVY